MILQTMLQRLQASLLRGPGMNARPHNSRQRVDLSRLAAFHGEPIHSLLPALLGDSRKIEFPAKVPAFSAPDYPEAEWSDDQKRSRDAFDRQVRLLNKFRDIARDAQEYFDDHGEDALFIGFPLISIPPVAGKDGFQSARVLAPAAMVPVSLKVRQGARAGITIEATGEGTDLLIPNPALMAWIEQQTGSDTDDLFSDELGEDPWQEVAEILTLVSKSLAIPESVFTPETTLERIPKSEELPAGPTIIPGALIGLFPMTNPGLMRDTKWMLGREPELAGPVRSFLHQSALEVREPAPVAEAEDLPIDAKPDSANRFDEEYLVTPADPCQADAVRHARDCPTLVVHGPPGTGKSQTITNMIGDHLARGERVLFVCDKRTAIDVVKHRLDALGLGEFCGVIHDPQRDRRSFYMGLRDRLEHLVENEATADPADELRKVNERLGSLHNELRGYFDLLHLPDGDRESFHELVGRWLGCKAACDPDLTLGDGVEIDLELIDHHRADLDEILRRATEARLSTNPFFENLEVDLAGIISLRTSEIEGAFRTAVELAQSVDTASEPELPELEPGSALPEQASFRREIADALESLFKEHLQAGSSDAVQSSDSSVAVEMLARLGSIDSITPWFDELGKLTDEAGLIEVVLDRELTLQIGGAPPALGEINRRILALSEYQEALRSWTRVFAFGKKTKATEALAPLALATEPESVERGLSFYRGMRARWLVSDLISRFLEADGAPTLLTDSELRARLNLMTRGLKIMERVETSTSAERITSLLRSAYAEPDSTSSLVARLRLSADRAERIEVFDKHVEKTGLFTSEYREKISNNLRANEAVAPIAQSWLDHHATLETVARASENLKAIPPSLTSSIRELALQEASFDAAVNLLTLFGCENAISRRIRSTPKLLDVDSTRVDAAFRELMERLAEKQTLTVQLARRHWEQRQRSRLLANTGTRLAAEGAALRQRLYVRGKKALKLRQMIAAGSNTDGGDPLFDLCPVWMAGPSTVAQIFPRETVFDVVIFDEASQCRLEEALPVLLRAKRVVIAGDPRQLPPTRFFESALVESDDTDAETAEELMIQQMSENEDLLVAALSLDVQEVFLDVHYRSRNESLIGFSNAAFYHDRLQPIPGHPKHKARTTPISIAHVGGVYDKRTNHDEARAVAQLVAELLDDPEPPSIGIACFNLTQKDTILEALDELVADDRAFAERLEAARHRRGRDSFEGLFVKNLENVQGDERDHIIISTTFGPAPDGKFRRNFGALSRIGGERRLNVLVTRARSAVHVLTSIPEQEYRASNMLPDGTQPNGRHFLYEYLRYVEQTQNLFNDYQSYIESLKASHEPTLEVREARNPSRLAVELGSALKADKNIGSTVHWGNEGFCVDIALMHPALPEDVTVGILTDFNRYRKSSDPVAWELFRTLILKSQGWDLHRHWSPAMFRDLGAAIASISDAHISSMKRITHQDDETKSEEIDSDEPQGSS